MKNKTFFDSVKCSVKGLLKAIKTEKNYKIYFINVGITLIINIICNFSYIEYLIWGITIVGVFSAECINTGIEKICDFLTKENNTTIGFIKDVAAGAVLCWGIAFYGAEAIMIGVKIWSYFNCT